MNREMIEQAALQYTMNESGLDYIGEVACENGFIAGAEWRINSVWHDRKEAPTTDKVTVLLLMYKDKGCRTALYGPSDWKSLIADDGFVKWAYAEDLIPTV